MSISTKEEAENHRETDADPALVRTNLCFLLSERLTCSIRKYFLSANVAEVACFPYRLVRKMGVKNVMTLIPEWAGICQGIRLFLSCLGVAPLLGAVVVCFLCTGIVFSFQDATERRTSKDALCL